MEPERFFEGRGKRSSNHSSQAAFLTGFEKPLSFVRRE
jgi:hypothetical protein